MSGPATEAGRRLREFIGGEGHITGPLILAIEAEARAEAERRMHNEFERSDAAVREQALREAAERVRALRIASPTVNAVEEYVAAVLAILDPESRP